MDDKTVAGHASGRKMKRRPRETRNLKVAVKLATIDGEEGRRLHEIQKRVVFDILLSLASNPPPSDIGQVRQTMAPTRPR